MTQPNTTFAGSIPELYEQYLVPLIFEPYADDLAKRVAALNPARIIEVAAGTGVVTRKLAEQIPNAAIIATDLSEAMLNKAKSTGTSRPVEWREANAMELPFEDESVDVVVCQFGVMFFPDKIKAFSEAKRVLRSGGTFLFNVWGALSENELAQSVSETLERSFPNDPPNFLKQVPYGYYQHPLISQALQQAGFTKEAQYSIVSARSRAVAAHIPAVAYCQGTPVKNEIESRDASRLEEITNQAAADIAKRFGTENIDAKIQAHVVAVSK